MYIYIYIYTRLVVAFFVKPFSKPVANFVRRKVFRKALAQSWRCGGEACPSRLAVSFNRQYNRFVSFNHLSCI